MSGLLRAIVVVLALCVLGAVSWQLHRGSDRAAQDTARCLDPRQPGCDGHAARPAASPGARPGRPWGAGGAVRSAAAVSPGALDVFPPVALRMEVRAPAGQGPGEAGGSPLEAALQDLLRGLPPDLRQGQHRGTAGDPLATVHELLDAGGQVLVRVTTGRGGIHVSDYERGLAYELEADGSIRREGALLDPAEPPARRQRRLMRHWAASRADAAALARSPQGTAAFIDLRRAGLAPSAAARWAREATAPVPPYPAWARQAQQQFGPLEEGVLRSLYAFVSEVPLLSRLAAAVLGESLLQVAQRVGFRGPLLRAFLEGATSEDLALARQLPAGMVPLRIRADAPPAQRNLRALVGHPQRAALLTLAAATLEEALDRPEQVLRASGLPRGYPYLVLREQDGTQPRPLLVRTATLRSWARPIRPEDPGALARLEALPPDAPVAVEATLPASSLEALGLLRARAAPPGGALLRAFALAGPLRTLLADQLHPLAPLRRLLPGLHPPASYFGRPPFLYGVVRVGEERLARHGIPTGALLMLQAEQAGLSALAATFPEQASGRLLGGLQALLTAYQRASASFVRLRRTLQTSAAGQDVVQRWDLLEMQLALSGLAVGCQAGGSCPLPALRRPADGQMWMEGVRRAVQALRPRVLCLSLPRAEVAELSERLSGLLSALDRTAAALEPERRFRPATRDPQALERMAAYIAAATGEAPRPDPDADGVLLVRELDSTAYRERLSAWEAGQPPGTDLDGEILRLRRDRGELPATLGELVQRLGDALQAAPPEHLAPGESRVRPHRRVRQRLWAGLDRLSLVQTMDGSGALRDVELLIERPDGTLEGVSYDADGHLVVGPGRGVLVGGSACLRCHRGPAGHALRWPPAPWRPGAGGLTWLQPVAAAELPVSSAAHRARDLP
ncbi:MAG: hypothetical protein RMK29_11570 [Myxococcales bacterium]|nr:hypothetical protein [Myxococcota bacterium]MDW8282346.1 hypothetical protein [Myxococcales bacterium]